MKFVFLILTLIPLASFGGVEKLSHKTMTNLENKLFSESGEWNEKWKMVYQLATSKESSESIRFLNKCIDSEIWFLQSAALKSFSKLYPQEGLVKARELISKAPSLIVRTESVEYLKQHGGEGDVKLLFKALKSTKNFRGRYSLKIRSVLVNAILILDKDKLHKESWKKLRHDSDKYVRGFAREQSKKNTQF